MPIGFPASPTTGQQWPAVDPLWEWDGTKWTAIGGSGIPGTATPVTDRLTSLTATDDTIYLRGGVPHLVSVAVQSSTFGGTPPAPTAPAAMTAGQWTAEATLVAGQIGINIVTLPSDGGSAITALEYRVGTGAAIALSGTGTGLRTVTSGFSAGVAADIQVRAVNAVGAGAWSDTKNRTPLAGGGGVAYLGQQVFTGVDTIVTTIPVGVTATDTVYAVIAGGDHGVDTTGLATYAGPAGWTPVDSATASTNGTRLFSAPGNVANLTFSVAGMRSVTLVGVRGTLRNSAMAQRYFAAGDIVHTSPSVVAGAGDLVVAIYIQQDGTAPTFGAPTTDYSPAFTKVDAAPYVRIATRTSAPAGATGDVSAGGGLNYSTRVVVTLAIQP